MWQRLRSVPGAERNEEVQTLVPIRAATRKAVVALWGGWCSGDQWGRCVHCSNIYFVLCPLCNWWFLPFLFVCSRNRWITEAMQAVKRWWWSKAADQGNTSASTKHLSTVAEQAMQGLPEKRKTQGYQVFMFVLSGSFVSWGLLYRLSH